LVLFKEGYLKMKETNPEVKKQAYEKPQVFKEGDLTDISAAAISGEPV
jgi:hypothetical protein